MMVVSSTSRLSKTIMETRLYVSINKRVIISSSIISILVPPSAVCSVCSEHGVLEEYPVLGCEVIITNE